MDIIRILPNNRRKSSSTIIFHKLHGFRLKSQQLTNYIVIIIKCKMHKRQVTSHEFKPIKWNSIWHYKGSLLFRGFYLKDVILKICYMSEVSASTIVFCYTEMHSKSSPYVYMLLLNEVDVTVLWITGWVSISRF